MCSGSLRTDLANPVLDGLRWAYPFRLADRPLPAESAIEITVTGPEVHARWDLVCDGTTWQFGSGHEGSVVAWLQMTTEQAWRLLTNNYHESTHGPVDATGDSEIVDTLRRTRAIIGTPK